MDNESLKDWTGLKIIGRLAEKNLTLSIVAEHYNVSVVSLRNAIICNSLKGEFILAQALELEPQEIWPNRYYKSNGDKIIRVMKETIINEIPLPDLSGDDWINLRIRNELNKKGHSLESLAVANELSRLTLRNNVLNRHWPKGELIIADALGIEPQEIWPSRYTIKLKKMTIQNTNKIGRKTTFRFSSCSSWYFLNKNEIIPDNIKNWSREKIKHELSLKGFTLQSLSLKYNYSPHTLNNAIRAIWPKGECIIASALSLTPQEIWPLRYYNKKYRQIQRRIEICEKHMEEMKNNN